MLVRKFVFFTKTAAAAVLRTVLDPIPAFRKAIESNQQKSKPSDDIKLDENANIDLRKVERMESESEKEAVKPKMRRKGQVLDSVQLCLEKAAVIFAEDILRWNNCNPL